MTWLALLAVVVCHIFLYKTPMGLKIRAVGENKNAAESVGISSKKIQYIALILKWCALQHGRILPLRLDT